MPESKLSRLESEIVMADGATLDLTDFLKEWQEEWEKEWAATDEHE